MISKIKTQTKIIDRGERHILQQIGLIGGGVSITSGVHQEEGTQLPRWRGRPVGEVPIAQYADWNEFGNDRARVPARPTLRPTVENNADLYCKQTAAGMNRIYKGGYHLHKLMVTQSIRVRAWIRSAIKNYSGLQNSPKTIRTKRRKGYGTHPLMATKSFYNSITSKIHFPWSHSDIKDPNSLKSAYQLKLISRKIEDLVRGS